MTWYKTGTVAVTPGSNAVIGTGTSFIANSRVGDGFRGPDGGWYEITNIASDTAMSISPPYGDPSAYAIAPLQGYVKESADQLRAATKVIASAATDMTAQIEEAKASAVSATAAAAIATSKASDSATSAASATSRAAAALASQNAAKTSENTAKTYADQAAASVAVPLSTPLNGLSFAVSAAIAASDTIISAFGKLQAQSTLGGWGTPKGIAVDINALTVNQQFNINTSATTANIPLKFGSSTVPFPAGSTGILSAWQGNPGNHWQMLIFDRTSNSIAYRRKDAGVIQPDDYLVVYPTGKTVLDISQGGTGSATGVPTMVGATSSAAGVRGLVPAPAAGDQAKFLNGAGGYSAPPSTGAWGAITGTLSSQTDLQAALDTKGSIITKKWTGAAVTVTAGAPMTIAHNLGIPAKIIRITGTLLTAAGGYSAGDTIDFGSCPVTLNGSLSFNYTFYNSGNNSFVAILGSSGIALNNKTTGAVTSLTASQVSIVFEVLA